METKTSDIIGIFILTTFYAVSIESMWYYPNYHTLPDIIQPIGDVARRINYLGEYED